MLRDRALRVALLLVGLLFCAGIFPVASIIWQRDQPGYTDAMMGSIYVALGVFLLLAVRNPLAHRSLIAFAGWSSLAHATVMAIMAWRDGTQRRDHLLGAVIFFIFAVPLLLLVPPKQPVERPSVPAT